MAISEPFGLNEQLEIGRWSATCEQLISIDRNFLYKSWLLASRTSIGISLYWRAFSSRSLARGIEYSPIHNRALRRLSEPTWYHVLLGSLSALSPLSSSLCRLIASSPNRANSCRSRSRRSAGPSANKPKTNKRIRNRITIALKLTHWLVEMPKMSSHFNVVGWDSNLSSFSFSFKFLQCWLLLGTDWFWLKFIITVADIYVCRSCCWPTWCILLLKTKNRFFQSSIMDNLFLLHVVSVFVWHFGSVRKKTNRKKTRGQCGCKSIVSFVTRIDSEWVAALMCWVFHCVCVCEELPLPVVCLSESIFLHAFCFHFV